MKHLTKIDYVKDKSYPSVVRAIDQLLDKSNYVAPVDVLLQMQLITKQQYEDWRFGRIGYLERVTIGGLGTMNRILRIIEYHCLAKGLKPSTTIYHKWGKGGKGIKLRFSKSGDSGLEAAYSRHYVLVPSKSSASAPERVAPDES